MRNAKYGISSAFRVPRSSFAETHHTADTNQHWACRSPVTAYADARCTVDTDGARVDRRGRVGHGSGRLERGTEYGDRKYRKWIFWGEESGIDTNRWPCRGPKDGAQKHTPGLSAFPAGAHDRQHTPHAAPSEKPYLRARRGSRNQSDGGAKYDGWTEKTRHKKRRVRRN